MDLRAIDDALRLQTDEAVLKRAATLRLHRRHHQAVKRRCCAGALRLHHCGFGSRCQLCSQDIHWLHFSVLTLFTNSRLLRRFRQCPGRLLCGGRVAAPSEGTFHFIVELLVGAAAYLSSQVRASHRKLARHRTVALFLRYFRSLPQVVRWAAALRTLCR